MLTVSLNNVINILTINNKYFLVINEKSNINQKKHCYPQ